MASIMTKLDAASRQHFFDKPELDDFDLDGHELDATGLNPRSI